MFARLVLALVLAILPFLGLLARSLDREQVYTLVVRMSATTAGAIQLFPDIGNGYRAERSSVQGVNASTEAREYRLPLAAGAYTSLRVDPGVGPGIYTIERMTLLDPSGTVHAEIPLAELALAYHLNLVERTAGRLVVECPPDAYDPQLVYTPSSTLWLVPSARSIASLVRWLALYVAVSFALLWVAQLAMGRLAPPLSRGLETIGRGAAAHPQIAVVAAALVATVVAMHPVLLLGRSLVSPNNGSVWMLYDQPPFVPGSADSVLEDVRGSDVGATMWAFVPYSMVQRRALASGELPLWNRYNGPGRPLWGQGQSFLLDPLHWLTLIGPDPAPGWDLKFGAHRFVLAWGIGVAALVATGAWLPSAMAASMAPFAGVFAFRFNHPATFAMTYAPWVLAGWFLLARARTNRARAGASVLLAMATALVLFASPPKEAVAMLVMAEATGLLALLLHVGMGRALLRPLAFAATAGVATVLFTTPQWLIFLQTLLASVTMYDAPHTSFADAGFALAMIIGPIADGMPLPALHALALPTIVAIVLSPIVVLRHRAILACLIGAAAVIAIAFGVIPTAVLTRIPLVANIHSVHVTFLTAALVPLLIASAAGIDALLHSTRAHTAIATAGTLAIAMWVFNGVGGVTALGRFQGWLVFGAMAGAVLVPMTLAVVKRGFPRILPLAAVTALGWIVMAPGGQYLETGNTPLDRVLVQPRLRVPLAVSSPSIDAIHARGGDPVRTAGINTILLPGSQALYNVEGVGGPDALFLRGSDELIGVGPTVRHEWRVVFPLLNLARDATVVDMMNVGYLLARFDEASAIGPSERTQETDLVRAIPRRSVWPRAFFIDRVGTYTTPDELVAQAREAGHPIASTLAGDPTAATITQEFSSGPADPIPATNYRLTTNTTTFHVRAPHAGMVVLAEAYMPDDFVATLNGAPVPYFRVNHAFKGVVVPGAGDWEVRFEYRPKHWELALSAMAVGGLIIVALGLIALRTGARRV